MIDCYRLDETNALVLCTSLVEWATWMGTNDNRVALTQFSFGHLSTVFLGIPHGLTNDLLFETMYFGDDGQQAMTRYRTYGEAKAGHDLIAEAILKQGNECDPTRLLRSAV